jgi:hypothetical protein
VIPELQPAQDDGRMFPPSESTTEPSLTAETFLLFTSTEAENENVANDCNTNSRSEAESASAETQRIEFIGELYQEEVVPKEVEPKEVIASTSSRKSKQQRKKPPDPRPRTSLSIPNPWDDTTACIVCNSEIRGGEVGPKRQPSENLKLKQYFCDMMGVSGGEGSEMNFEEQDSFPFCGKCSGEVMQLMNIGAKIEFMYKQFDKLRDSIAVRSVSTFFARTKPDLVQRVVRDDKETVKPWERVAKSESGTFNVYCSIL